MNQKKKTNNKQKSDNLMWTIAYELGFRLLLWIVAPIIIALFVGKSLDLYYNTSGPIFFSCFIGIAFIISSVGIVKESVKSMKYLDELADREKENKSECTDKIEKK